MSPTYQPTPTRCDVCRTPLSDDEGTVMVDGRTAMGPWACMCGSCHATQGVGLGVGFGQKYTRRADGLFHKEIDQ